MIDYKKENLKRMIAYFHSGCKEKGRPFTEGLELEHFIVAKETKESIPYSGERGIEALLEKLKPNYTETAYSEGHLIGLGRENMSVSIEPAAQLEVSISPQKDGRAIQAIYDQFLAEVTPILQEWGYDMLTLGYQPKNKVEELELIPKNRYRFMEEYFNRIGPYGRYMMKGTAATQISIDYYSEEDFSEKYKIAYGLYPIFAMLCDNVPWFEGKKNKEPLLRMKIWDNVDKARVDVGKYLNEGTLDFERYAEFVYNAPLIVDKEKEGDYATNKSAGELFSHRLMTVEEIEHVLSMVFPMIRLKHYVEIRVADSMPIESVKAYLLWIKGLFKDISKVKPYVDQLYEKCGNINQQLLEAIRKEGIHGRIGERTVRNIVKDLFAMVLENLTEKEVEYLKEFQEGIVKKGSLVRVTSKEEDNEYEYGRV